MAGISLESLTEQLEVADQLRAGRDTMHEPQDLPGRYGRVVRALDHVLQSMACESVVGGGWAVWHHGYVSRVTQDIDIALAAHRIDEFLRVAAVSGFDVLTVPAGRWPKVRHKETGIKVDLLPEGARPGTTAKPAPTLIPHPARMGAAGTRLRYMSLPSLMELKLAAGRGRDESDVIELLRVHPDQANAIRAHLAGVHADYVAAFDRLVDRAREQQDE